MSIEVMVKDSNEEEDQAAAAMDSDEGEDQAAAMDSDEGEDQVVAAMDSSGEEEDQVVAAMDSDEGEDQVAAMMACDALLNDQVGVPVRHRGRRPCHRIHCRQMLR